MTHSYWSQPSRLNSIRHRCLLAGFICLALPGLLPASHAQALPRVVNSLADNQNDGCSTADNGCTLREAIGDSASGDTITFNLPGSGPHTIDVAVCFWKIATRKAL